MMRGAVVVARRSELSQLARGGATTTPGAVVVALLSQLSQQCGAALVRVRDEMVPSTTFSRVVARRAVVPSCGTDGVRTHSALGQAPGSLRQTCGVGKQESFAHRLPAKPSRHRRRDARETNTDLRGSARETLARRGRLDAGDLHDDRRLLELMERRRRVQHPLQGLDQFRYHYSVVPHLDDLRLGREPRDGEARHSGARARGRDDPWCKPALGRGVSARCFVAFWLFEAMLHFRPGRLARRPSSTGESFGRSVRTLRHASTKP